MDRDNDVSSSNARLLHKPSYSQHDPAHVTIGRLCQLIAERKHERCVRHVEQVNCRSNVEYPGSILLKALHLVHAHHRHKTCKEVKRARVKKSVRRNLLSPMQVRDKPTKNEHEKHETEQRIRPGHRVREGICPNCFLTVCPRLFLLLIRKGVVGFLPQHKQIKRYPPSCERP